MDSPGGIPEASSPVVLLPTPQFPWPEIATSAAGRPSPRNSSRNTHPRTRSTGTILQFPPVPASINPFAGSHGLRGADRGPTTRSRRRSSHRISSRDFVAETEHIPDPLPNQTATSRQSRKRKASSQKPSSAAPSSKRCRSINRKKPPPGAGLKKPPPSAVKKECADDNAEKKPEASLDTCCICMCEVERNDIAQINSCDHRFCFECIEKWAERENTCPLCKVRFTKIERVNKKRGKKGERAKNVKKVKQRDQRSDIQPGAALEGLIANLNRGTSLARIIFGAGWEPTLPNSARTPFPASLGFEDESEDDDDSPMAAFMRALHGGSAASGIRMSTTVVRPLTVTTHRFTTTTTTTTRSYARNVHDVTAGNGAENPLEIDDDSVEEVIEIE